MHSPNSFRPLVSRLEDRCNPSGNITARVIGGTLFVDGDENSNAVVIAGCGWRSVAVRPGDSDTVVNGLPGGQGVFLGDITRGIVVRTNGGDDAVLLDGVRNRHYVGVFTGAGNDLVILNGVTTKNGATEIDTGDGDDSVQVTDSKFGGTAAVNLGTGNDTLEVTGSNIRKQVRFNGGAGNDALGADGAQFRTSIGYANFERVVNGPLPPPPSPPGPPSVVISSSAGESTAAATIPFTVTFSEPVTGFTLNDLSVTNGTPANLTTFDNTTFTFDVTPTEDGAVTVDLPANSAIDASREGNTAATPVTVRSIRTDAGMTNTLPNVNDPNWVATGSGLAIWDIQKGSGTPVTPSTSQVQVFYTGWLTNGTVFDSARTTGQPATFNPSKLIPGFREGLIGMQPGGIRRLRIPPELGYGAAGNPPTIPGNATLIFEVKLVSVTPG